MAFSNPEKNIAHVTLQPGMKVADFGSGSGHYAIAAAKAVGDSGRVYAIDIQKELLSKLKKVAQEERLSNIEIIWGDLEEKAGSTLTEHSVNAVLLANTLFQMERRGVVIEEVKRVLKPKGKVLFIEWSDSHGGLGPQQKDVVSPVQVKELFDVHGFAIEQEFEAGDHHYGLVFTKN